MITAKNHPRIEWPGGKQFAFTIIDDTDKSTLENVRPMYDLLFEQGLLATKTVWPLAPMRHHPSAGTTLEDRPYRNWVCGLSEKGFERRHRRDRQVQGYFRL
jgi:hypothetical protein